MPMSVCRMSQFLLATFPQVVRYCLPDFLSLLVLLTWDFVCYFHKYYIYTTTIRILSGDLGSTFNFIGVNYQ